MNDIERLESHLDKICDIERESILLVRELVSRYGRFDLSESEIENDEYPISISVYLRYGMEEIRVTSVYEMNESIFVDGYSDNGKMVTEICIYNDFGEDILNFIHHILSADRENRETKEGENV